MRAHRGKQRVRRSAKRRGEITASHRQTFSAYTAFDGTGFLSVRGYLVRHDGHGRIHSVDYALPEWTRADLISEAVHLDRVPMVGAELSPSELYDALAWRS
jgi:hypothetical protein